MTDGDRGRVARVALSQLVEPGHRGLGEMVAAIGPVETLEQLHEASTTAELAGAASARLRGGDAWEAAAHALSRGDALGARLVTPDDDEWPHRLTDLTQISSDRDRHTYPPLCLWVRGPASLAESLTRSVAVVGARAATAYGTHVAAELTYGLAERGWTVVSGGAYGIDAAAHRGALAAGGITIAVLACGIDTIYPVGHADLFEKVTEHGLLISEWPPGANPQRHRFLVRNRVIAAATEGTVVVEAAARSGARHTARRARELGRALMAVPGPVTSAMSVGAHLVIRDEFGRLVTRAAEVVEEVGRIGDDLAPPLRGPETPRDRLDEVGQRVLDAVPPGRPAAVAQIAAEAGVASRDVRRALPALVLLGLVEQRADGYRLAPEPSATARAAHPPAVR